MTNVWVIGNGGHAKVVIDALRLQGGFSLAGILSDTPDAPAIESGIVHVGPISPETVANNGIRTAFIAVGDNVVRRRIAEQLDGYVEWVSIAHSTAIVSSSAMIGKGVLLCAGSIVQPYASIGDHAIINTAASVDHDSHISPFVHVAPGCHLAGSVSVGEATLIGVGTSVIPGVVIGADSVVGAGSVVIRDVSDSARVAGVPARPIDD